MIPEEGFDPGPDPEDDISWDPDNSTVEGEGNYGED